jgi:hypothetical protein
MILITNDDSTLEVITTDSLSGEGTGLFTISIYNEMCKDSAHINLEEDEARKLRDELNEWLDDIVE